MMQVDWKSEENRPVKPKHLGTKVYKEYAVKDILDYIDWNPFFQVNKSTSLVAGYMQCQAPKPLVTCILLQVCLLCLVCVFDAVIMPNLLSKGIKCWAYTRSSAGINAYSWHV